MSGLELAAGIIGLTQFGAEAIGLSLKFRKLWKEVQGASEEVDDLLDNITDASHMIQEIERQVEQSSLVPGPSANEGFRRILERAQKARTCLQEAVDLLDKELRSSKKKSRRLLSSTKIVLKKPVLELLEKKLSRSMQMLHFATQVHVMSIASQAATFTAEVHRITREAEVRRITQEPQVLDEVESPQADPNDARLQKAEVTCLKASTVRKRRKGSHLPRAWTWTGRLTFGFSAGGPILSFQAPSWIASSMYSIVAESTVCGPQLTLRRYETIEAWSPRVQKAVAQDDLPALLDYARDQGLSLFSTDAEGTSLVTLAFDSGAVQTMKGLLALGLGVFTEWIEDHSDSSSIASDWLNRALPGWHNFRRRDDPGSSKRLEALHMLVPYGFSILVNHEDLFVYVAHELTYTGSSHYQDLFMPKIRRPSPDLKQRLAYKFLLSMYPNDIRHIFPELIDSSDPQIQSGVHGSALLHCLAAKLANMMAVIWIFPPEQQSGVYRWVSRCAATDPEGLHQQLSAKDIDSSSEDRYLWLCRGLTPFWVYMAGLLYKTADSILIDPASMDSCVSYGTFVGRTLPTWLLLLKRGGVDLRTYGKREQQLSKKMPSFSRSRLSSLQDQEIGELMATWIRLRIIAIDFGPQIEDWTVWYAWEYEYFAKEFWDLIENPPCHVPGAWDSPSSGTASERVSIEAYVDLDDDDTRVIWKDVSQHTPSAHVVLSDESQRRDVEHLAPLLDPLDLEVNDVNGWR